MTTVSAACNISAALLVFSLPAAYAQADDSGTQPFSLRGFGTLGATHSNQKDADFVGNFFQPNGAGHWRPVTINTDTKLGVQADARFSDKFSGVIQAVSQYRYDSTYTPQLEWANIKYQVTPDFDVRIGRFVASTFLLSDTSLVSYSYTPIRPPQEVYALLPFSNKDGIDASYRFDISDEIENVVEFSYGRTNHKLAGNGEVTARRYLDLHTTLEYGQNTFRIGYTTLDATLTTPGIESLFDGLVQFGNSVPGPAGQQALEIAHERRLGPAPYTIMTAGFVHDTGNWLLMTEWARASTQNPISASDVTAWHVTGAYRFRALTPYITAAQVRPHKLAVPPIPTAGLPAPAVAAAAALSGGLQAVINAFAFSQDSISTGVRWDFMKNRDLKFQYDHLRTGATSSGRLINAQPAFRPSESADILSVALDFVF